MVNAQEWLDKNYPKAERWKAKKIYLNEPRLEGELDLGAFTYSYSGRGWKGGVEIHLSPHVDKTKLIFKNLPEEAEIIRNSWVDIHEEFGKISQRDRTKTHQQLWEERGLTYQDVQEWVKIGFAPDDLYYVEKWKERFNHEEVKQLIAVGFQKSDYTIAEEWKDHKFSTAQILEWINKGDLRIGDACYAYWLRDIKSNDEKYNEYSVEVIANFKLDIEVIIPLKKIEREKRSRSDRYLEEKSYYNNNDITENKINVVSIVDKLIPDPDLKERYTKYGLCKECDQPKTDADWCRFCNAQYFHKDFKNWTSGSWSIDELIRESQLSAFDNKHILEWIPYERFTKIEFLAEGGFGKVYRAQWIDGPISQWNIRGWKREKQNSSNIVLKSLNQLGGNLKANFLQEITFHALFEGVGIVKCYGISQDLQTSNYLMVMDYQGDNMRQYLKNNYSKLDFSHKLGKLFHISRGLNLIHEQKLIHKDLHPGNILNPGINTCYITDLGLCGLVNDTSSSEEIFGVLPYVAPEVLQDKKYTQAADIYSFGMVAYELFSGSLPFHEIPHDFDLAMKICQGLRPNLDNARVPQKLKNLIKRCWDADPLKRPNSKELSKTLGIWYIFENGEDDVEFDQQYKEMKTKEEEVLRDSLLKLYQELKGQTKEIKTEEVWKIKQELFWEFCRKHNYKRDSEETRKKFELLFPEAIRRSVNDNRHSRAIYHSRLLNTKGLPCPQNNHSQEWQASTFLELLRNSQSGNKVSRASISQPVESISVYLTEQVENLNIQEDSTETSLQAQIQISPK